ncbi:MAG: hypothetical protein IJ037_14835 [Clostridia bacterium]|nr:hypothetical protein [Clostridia bacterium]
MIHEITLSGLNCGGIRIRLESVYRPPEGKFTGYEDCFGTIEIRTVYFRTAEDAPLWTSVNSLQRFCRELEECHRTLSGTAGHETYENNLALSVTMTKHGHAEVRGTYQPDMADDNILHFRFDTDQTMIAVAVRDLRKFLDSAMNDNI